MTTAHDGGGSESVCMRVCVDCSNDGGIDCDLRLPQSVIVVSGPVLEY
jgi:hypothetical protein